MIKLVDRYIHSIKAKTKRPIVMRDACINHPVVIAVIKPTTIDIVISIVSNINNTL